MSMNETPPDDDSSYGDVEQIDTNPGGHEPAELQGICFGDLVPQLPCVLIRLQVRVTVDGKVIEGARDPMMIAYATLKELNDNLPLCWITCPRMAQKWITSLRLH